MDCNNCNSCEKFSSHEWRVNCNSCNCHSTNHRSFVNNRLQEIGSDSSWINSIHSHLTHNQIQNYKDAISLANESGFMWLPIGVEVDQMETFKQVWNSLDPVFKLENTKENRFKRSEMFSKQLPKSDLFGLAKSASESLTNHAKDSADSNDNWQNIEVTFKEERDLENFGFGEVDQPGDDENCYLCQKPITRSDRFSVQITHDATITWHVGCFKCLTCATQLFDFHYLWDEESKNVYCMKHYDNIRYNRCGACETLIFDRDFTKAMSQEYHVNHFACKNCDKLLTGERYIMKEDDPFCLDCFNELFSNKCDRCSEIIKCDNKDLSFNERHWHYECFNCDACNKSLFEKQFGSKEDKLYCPECYEEKFTPQCDKCKKPFKQGTKKFEYNGQQWHEDCFLCVECSQVIGAGGFVPRPAGLICISCYENNYAQRCAKCKKVIRKGGVTYHGESWHRECFGCAKCGCLLADIKFTSKEDKPYCPDCFGELFSKRCKHCKKPISGFGGCKYVSLENDNWHTDCFMCSSCQISLVEKGFMNRDNKIYCVTCYNSTENAEDK